MKVAETTAGSDRGTSMCYAGALVAILICVLPQSALAHSEVGVAGGAISGFLHPLSGLDHVVAMVAVGLWGAFLGAPAIWLLPIVFPLIMVCGGVLGIIGVPVPMVEIGIAVSAVVLGLLVAGAVRLPIAIAAAIVGAFGMFHGYAHGTELPNAANAIAYSAGFVVATGMLHLTGVALGLLTRWPYGIWAVRGGGLVVALVGVFFLRSAM